MLKSIFSGAALIAALAAQTPQPPQPAPTPAPIPTFTPMPGPTLTPVPLPSVSPSPSPTPSPSATPSVTPSPVPSTLPSAAPAPLPTPLVLPADAPPEILAVQLSNPVVHSGDVFTGTIVTSTNVAAVEVHLAGRSVRIPRADFGIWQWSYQIPRVPFWMRKTYTAQVVAMNTAGLEAERDVTVSLR